jgi:hypothetical protein
MQSPEFEDRRGTVVRPPRLYLGFLLLGLALDYRWPLSLGLPAALRFSAGPTLIVFGFALRSIAMRQFKKAGTNVPTIRPTVPSAEPRGGRIPGEATRCPSEKTSYVNPDGGAPRRPGPR